MVPAVRVPALLLLALIAVDAAAQAPARRPAQRLPIANEDARAYDTCLVAARKEPAKTYEDAQVWRVRGGGDAARHCAAVAMLEWGEPRTAAAQLERLAIDLRARDPALRAEVLAQAAQAWLVAGDAERANAAATTTAIEIAPRNPELWIDRAEALALAKNYWEAIDDLNNAVELDPRRADALAFRAAAYRFVDVNDLAFEDAERAIAVDPKLADAWLERGILNRLKGNLAGARRDWLQVLVLDPEGAAGDAARANIERLELKLDDQPAPAPPRAPRR